MKLGGIDMKVAVVGSGAREHALIWAYSKSHRIDGLGCFPGNAGISNLADCFDCDLDNLGDLVNKIQEYGPDLVFIGPEAPLDQGLADELRRLRIPTVGPGKDQARLESSKVFGKEFMKECGIPTARSSHVRTLDELKSALSSFDPPWVLKKSGLAAGKGVLETQDHREALNYGMTVLQDDELVVEEYLRGYEASVFVALDGKNHLVLPPCADHKKAEEGDSGLNTGGMGAICPVPLLRDKEWQEILSSVVEPVVYGLKTKGLMYQGILFIGLMVTNKGPRVLEFNVRLGDPETQALLPRIRNDFVDFTEAIITGQLDKFTLDIDPMTSISVVVASEGYPKSYRKNIPVQHLPLNRNGKFVLFHAATKFGPQGEILTTGGRCFSVVGLGDTFEDAQRRANQGASEVHFEGAWFRKDIGRRLFDMALQLPV